MNEDELKIILEKHHIPVKWIAERCGVSRWQLDNYKKGKSKIPGRIAKKMRELDKLLTAWEENRQK